MAIASLIVLSCVPIRRHHGSYITPPFRLISLNVWGFNCINGRLKSATWNSKMRIQKSEEHDVWLLITRLDLIKAPSGGQQESDKSEDAWRLIKDQLLLDIESGYLSYSYKWGFYHIEFKCWAYAYKNWHEKRNANRSKKWNRRFDFKSLTRLLAFHFVLMPFTKV